MLKLEELNESCILIPSNAAEEIIAFLSKFNIKTRKLEVKLSEESLKTFSILA